MRLQVTSTPLPRSCKSGRAQIRLTAPQALASMVVFDRRGGWVGTEHLGLQSPNARRRVASHPVPVQIAAARLFATLASSRQRAMWYAGEPNGSAVLWRLSVNPLTTSAADVAVVFALRGGRVDFVLRSVFVVVVGAFRAAVGKPSTSTPSIQNSFVALTVPR